MFSTADSSLFQAVLFLAATVLYLIDWDEYLAFLVLCLALSWVNVLYFSRGQVQMGIYSVMIQKVVPAGRCHDQVARFVAPALTELRSSLCSVDDPQ